MITEENFIDFKCPYCGEPVSFPRESAGFAQACPNCTQSLIVPDDGSEVGWQIPLPITTARLVLRRLAPPDWQDLLELASDEEFGLYSGGVPSDEDGVLRWLESDAHVKLTTPDQTIYLGVMLQEGSKLIGLLSMNFTDAQRLQASSALAPTASSSGRASPWKPWWPSSRFASRASDCTVSPVGAIAAIPTPVVSWKKLAFVAKANS